MEDIPALVFKTTDEGTKRYSENYLFLYVCMHECIYLCIYLFIYVMDNWFNWVCLEVVACIEYKEVVLFPCASKTF